MKIAEKLIPSQKVTVNRDTNNIRIKFQLKIIFQEGSRQDTGDPCLMATIGTKICAAK